MEMETGKNQTEDLTQIRGIGSAVQAQLRDALGVQTFADLASLNAAEIEAALKADKSIPAPARAPRKIEQWLAAAQELAGMDAEEGERPSPTTITWREEAAIPVREMDWHPVASFVVEFQSRVGDAGIEELRTAVHHMETDRGTQWPGVEQARLCEWMADKAHLSDLVAPALVANVVELVPAVTEELPAPALAPTAFSWEKDVQALWVAVSQTPETPAVVDLAAGQRPFLAHVSHARPLDLQFNFALPAGGGAGLPLLAYRAYCQLINLAQRQQKYLEMEISPAAAEEPQFTASLSTISLEPGIYEVGVFMRGERPLGSLYFRFPKLNVL